MCGITGWVDWQLDLTRQRDTAELMTQTMACRGPDATGLWCSSRAALGHRRLAVIDPAGGQQPMAASADGRPVVLTFSGEVYNFQSLRQDLTARGHRLRTRSDTEVVLHSYLEWGDDCAGHLDGMFAFAVWDERVQGLLLVRDRLGIKPLYYARTDTGLLFGSEPKAVLANPAFTAEVGPDGLAEIFGLYMARTPGHGTFAGLQELLPGTTLQVDAGTTRHRRYWRLSALPHTDDGPATARRVRALLDGIVARHLVGDVPLCSLLSGGLDSSAVTALAVQQLDAHAAGPLETFAVAFADDDRFFRPSAMRPTLDAPYVRRMVDHLDVEHTDILLRTADLLEQQPHTLAARDLPGFGDMDAALYLLCKAVRARSTVALSGEAADEVFGGYPWFRSPPDPAHRFPWRATIPDIADLLTEDARRRLRLDEYVADRYSAALAEVPQLDGEAEADRRIRAISYLTLTRFLPSMLDRKDRMSMAVGLEVRVPYCDHRLVEYVWNVPWSIRTAGGVEKGILRAAVADVLPPEIAARRKSAFPAIQDPAYDRVLGDRLQDCLAASTAPLDGLIDRAGLRSLLADDERAGVGWSRARALGKNLLEIDGWMRRYRVRIRC